MSVYHDEVEIEDFEYDEETETYYYPCPCGDRFEISKMLKINKSPVSVKTHENIGCDGTAKLMEDLANGEDVATCPSCSLVVKVIYNLEDFQRNQEERESKSNKVQLEVAQ